MIIIINDDTNNIIINENTINVIIFIIINIIWPLLISLLSDEGIA